VLANWGNVAAINGSLAEIAATTGLDAGQGRALVPEPGSMVFLALVGLALRRR
jgi:hypothetical protein